MIGAMTFDTGIGTHVAVIFNFSGNVIARRKRSCRS